MTKGRLVRLLMDKYPGLPESTGEYLRKQDRKVLQRATEGDSPLAWRLELNSRLSTISGHSLDIFYKTEEAEAILDDPDVFIGSFGECPDIEKIEHSARWLSLWLRENNILVRDASNEYKDIVRVLCERKTGRSEPELEKGIVYMISATPEVFIRAIRQEAKRMEDLERQENPAYRHRDFESFLPIDWGESE